MASTGSIPSGLGEGSGENVHEASITRVEWGVNRE